MKKRNDIRFNVTNSEILRIGLTRAFVIILLCFFISRYVNGQAIRVNLSIKDKIVLAQQEPFVFKPAIDFTTNTRIMEGSCVLTLTGADNLWVKATMPAFVILHNELDERILCSTTLSYRNDEQKEYNGNDVGNEAIFPLSKTGKLNRRTQGASQLYKAYLFVFIRTRSAELTGDSYSGDVHLSIEYN